jgi:hypothetical protein
MDGDRQLSMLLSQADSLFMQLDADRIYNRALIAPASEQG